MTFETAVRTCLHKYATFSGRAGRAEFWWFALFVLLGHVVAGAIDWLIFRGHEVTGTLFSLAVLLPGLAVSVRRLHDSDHRGWWVLLHLVPLIGWLVMLYFYLIRGSEGANRFGPPPPR